MIWVDAPDNLFPQIVSYLNQYSSDELYFVEDSKPSFVVNTLDDAKERILRAEKNNIVIKKQTKAYIVCHCEERSNP